MGQNQLMLIIIGMILVGLMVASAIVFANDSAISSNRDAVASDLMLLATKARQYYSTPKPQGGGGFSFAGLEAGEDGVLRLVSGRMQNNDNGTYTIKTAGTKSTVVIQGVGKVQINASEFPTVECTVTPSGQSNVIIQ